MKVTVSEFLAKGFKFVEGDKRESFFINESVVTLSSKGAEEHNTFDLCAKVRDCTVYFPMAWREDFYEIPCNGKLWVDCLMNDCSVKSFKPSSVFNIGNIKAWRPSIKNWEVDVDNLKLANEALIKMEKGKSNFHSYDDAKEILKSRREVTREQLEKENQPISISVPRRDGTPCRIEPMENQIEKAIRESEEMSYQDKVKERFENTVRENKIESREADSTPWKPKTAEGKRELAAQLLTEANKLDKQVEIEKHARNQALELYRMGWIDESDIEDVTNNHIEFYKDMELF